nr:MAG TPA: hypothetical protein [Caudoviricetes sp.]
MTFSLLIGWVQDKRGADGRARRRDAQAARARK